MEDLIAKKCQSLSGSLNERQRRLWAATETLSKSPLPVAQQEYPESPSTEALKN